MDSALAVAIVAALTVIGTVLPIVGVVRAVRGLSKEREARRSKGLLVADFNAEHGPKPPSLEAAWRGMRVDATLVVMGVLAAGVAGVWSLFLK